ncbi:MAG TPA: serine/threonine-protein kinase [Gemmatimonadaceae bacterium]|nr:serine/threonine-protein kinase [Gemmatimonadaceae bacterium]
MADFLSDLQAHFGQAYTIERELGGGGMSRVVLARDTRLERRVVIKVLPPSVTAEISSDRFKREIMLSAALQHPNIVPVLLAGEFGGLPYFVMPFIEGESLRARMMRGPLSVRETVSILKDVTRALTFAHGRGIIHRDIKPDNVLLSSGAAVVTDFGVAKALSASRHAAARPPSPTITGIGMSPGTPAYMAPEQAAADPSTDHRADLYSLGILAYEMLAGTPPFHGRTPQALLAAQLSEKPPPLSSRRYDVPRMLSDLIAQCLEKEPKRRPDTAQSVLRTLEDPAVVSGVFDAPVTSRRRTRPSTIVSLLLIGSLGVSAAWMWRSNRAAASAPADLLLPAPAATPVAVDRSIAVLPLEGIGQDTRAREVARGLTSEVTGALVGINGMRVSSEASAIAIRDRIRAASDSGPRPDVAMLLEGTVQREREAMRVVVRLVQTANDSTLWSQVFNGSADSTLALQSNVARAVTAAVVTRVR